MSKNKLFMLNKTNVFENHIINDPRKNILLNRYWKTGFRYNSLNNVVFELKKLPFYFKKDNTDSDVSNYELSFKGCLYKINQCLK